MKNKIMKNIVVALTIAAMVIPATGMVAFASENQDCGTQVSEEEICPGRMIHPYVLEKPVGFPWLNDNETKKDEQEPGLFHPVGDPQVDPFYIEESEYKKKINRPEYIPENCEFDFLRNVKNKLVNGDTEDDYVENEDYVEKDTPDFSDIPEWMWVQA